MGDTRMDLDEAPPEVVVNDRFEIVQSRGAIDDFLSPASNPPASCLWQRACDGLAEPLREALETARSRGVSVHRPGVAIGGPPPRWITLEVVPLAGLADGTEPRFLVLFEADAQAEISRLELANEELQTRNLQLHLMLQETVSVLDIIELPIIVLAPDLGVRRANRTARVIAGELAAFVAAAAGGIDGHPRSGIDLAELVRRIRNTLTTGAPDAYDADDARGRRRRFRLRPLPRGDHGGDGIVLWWTDGGDAERRLARATERQARLAAEQANQAKDIFLATLSHELRTPLSTILMSAALLHNAATSDPRITRACAAIERAVGTQARLIDDLLDISRIVSGKMVIDLQPVDLAAVVHDAVDVAEFLASAKGITIEVAVGPVGRIHGDATRLQQVVSNLLHNAIKFTRRGGTVAVRLEADGGRAVLTVRDDGIGMRAEIIPHLFDRFVQGDEIGRGRRGGLGLGLAIVRHIVEVHGGVVEAASDGEGHGSTFTVMLPLMPVAEVGAPAARPLVPRSVRGVRVLVIDGDDDARQACAMMLEEQGADVVTAGSSAQALVAVDTFQPQVILCELALPGDDGIAFIRALRATERGSAIPAAALTALATESDRTRALESGFQVHLAKPIDGERLADTVAALATRDALPGAPAPAPAEAASGN